MVVVVVPVVVVVTGIEALVEIDGREAALLFEHW